MLIATFLFSLGPVLIVASGAVDSPFLFNGTLRFGLLVGLAFIIYKNFPEYFSEEGLKNLFFSREILFHKKNLFLVVAALGAFDLVAFSKSTEHVNVAVTTLIGETQPLFHYFLFVVFGRLGYESTKYKFKWDKAYFMVFSLIGAVLVVISQPGWLVWPPEFSASAEAGDVAMGFAWALGYAALTSLGAPFTIRWAGHAAQTIRARTASSPDEGSDTLFFALLGTFVMNLIAFPVNLLIGFNIGETETFDDSWGAAGEFFVITFVGGALFYATGGILQRKSLIGTSHLGVVALQYLRPLFTLSALFLLEMLTGWTAAWLDMNLRWDYFGIGLAAIVVANILLNFLSEEDELRVGFKVLMAALWACGTIVYLRDKIAESLGIPGLVWMDGGYLEILALSTTAFTLIFSFRLARLVERTNNEERLTFSIAETLESLVGRNALDSRSIDKLLAMESTRDPQTLDESYRWLRRHLAMAAGRRDIDADGYQELSQLRVDVNSLAHSKQRDNNFAEIFALVIFASSTVALTLFAHPGMVGWSRFLGDLLSMQFAAVMIFLAATIIDFHQERNESTVTRYSDPPGCGVRLHSTENKGVEKICAIILGIFVTVIFSACLFAKWVVPS